MTRAAPDAIMRSMDHERPPDIDAEYRLVRGPWPRWAFHLGLLKLALRAGAVVAALLAITAVAALWIFRSL
jgi:hypothetical protein